MNHRPWPTDIRLLKREAVLEVDFDDGTAVRLPAEYLRVESPSAEVQGHGSGQKKTLGGKRAVAIASVQPVGNYAVRLLFSDGHDSGIYSWDYLYELGTQYEEKWDAYLQALAANGLTREGD